MRSPVPGTICVRTPATFSLLASVSTNVSRLGSKISRIGGVVIAFFRVSNYCCSFSVHTISSFFIFGSGFQKVSKRVCNFCEVRDICPKESIHAQ